jgi:hypothetical protein
VTLSRQFKPKECAVCQKSFLPLRALQVVCGVPCARRLAAAKKAQASKSLRERKAALKTIPDLIKEAQREFNAFIRARDALRPCICCNLPLGTSAVGGGFDCGHWRSVGSAPHLRFDERNAHGQRKQCNRYGAGRAVEYRKGLIQRIGLEAVEALEADNRIHKWQRDELIAIRDLYRKKRKELEKERE